MGTDDEYILELLPAEEPISEDLRGLLSDPHVRHLLQYLRHQNGPVDLPTVATQVAAGVTDTPPDEVPVQDRNRVQTFLHHGQLPTLARYGIVEFDRQSNTVALRR